MKKTHLIGMVILMMVVVFTGCNSKKTKKVKLATFEDSFSYFIGEYEGKSFRTKTADLKKNEFKINDDIVMAAYRSQLTDTVELFNEQTKQALYQKFQMIMQEKMSKKLKTEAEPNKKAGAEFLRKNKTEAGIKELPSGLQYRIIKEGTGKTPKDTDWVKVNYIGKLINGQEFENSYTMKRPGDFKLNKMIPGWIEGIPLIKEGGKIELYIPSDLGYGDNTPGDPIKPGSTLIFTVELLKVGEVPKQDAGAMPRQ